MSFMLLPDEILLEITKHIFPPWFASMSITSELKELQNAQVLRVNKFFHVAGLQAIRSSFSGEFQRLDRRGRITDDSNVGTWYPWLVQNTTTLHLLDSPSSLWYIDQYWKYYPRLKGFCVTITHDTASYSLTSNIHDLEQRQKRCNRVTANWLNGDLELRQYMWGELRRIWYSMISHDRQCWPELEIRNITCSCHAFRQTVSVLPRQIKADVVQIMKITHISPQGARNASGTDPGSVLTPLDTAVILTDSKGRVVPVNPEAFRIQSYHHWSATGRFELIQDLIMQLTPLLVGGNSIKFALPEIIKLIYQGSSSQ